MISETDDKQYLKTPSLARHLGVDVRPGSFGFVVIENATVLDSGVRMCDQSQFDDCLGLRFDRLLKTFRPSVVLVRDLRGLPAGSGRRRVRTAVIRSAKRDSVDVISIRPAVIRLYFGRFGATTKYRIAQCVAAKLPELAWKLPRNRKPWESEHYRMSIFDAAALVISYLEL